MTGGTAAADPATELAEVRRVLAGRARRRWSILAAATLVAVALAWLGTVHGITDITTGRLAATLLPGADRWAQPLDWSEWTALVDLRLPRIAMAIAAGAGLAWCGCGMQIITGNPMASPFTTGISNAAAFGAALAILGTFTIAGSAMTATVVMAFVMAAACSAVVMGLASIGRMGPTILILSGIALSYLFAAATAVLQYVSDEQDLSAIVRWTFGDLGRANWSQITLVAVIVGVAGGFMQARAGWYMRMAAGDETAFSLGVPVRRLRTQTMVLVTLVAATVISITGVIGFVGLVAPHIAALLVGADERYRLPLAGVVGAALVLGADLVGRTIVSPVIVPVGIVVSFLGVPMFLWLIIREGAWSRR
ncbi:iron ABC transporter permease [Gordonia caeni]|uniref:Iron ABC transporter permease n=1 Tax=Gordonia caeni TaxID=1007097 RepID=A0ABP7NWZ6_9ACTN